MRFETQPNGDVHVYYDSPKERVFSTELPAQRTERYAFTATDLQHAATVYSFLTRDLPEVPLKSQFGSAENIYRVHVAMQQEARALTNRVFPLQNQSTLARVMADMYRAHHGLQTTPDSLRLLNAYASRQLAQSIANSYLERKARLAPQTMLAPRPRYCSQDLVRPAVRGTLH